MPRSIGQAVPYFRVSLVVFGATALATASLAYVSYPTKVVFESAKLIPTMIVSTVMGSTGGSSYGPLDYLAAALLYFGAAGYSYNNTSSGGSSDNGDGTSDDSVGGSDSYYGVALLTVSIIGARGASAACPAMAEILLVLVRIPRTTVARLGPRLRSVVRHALMELTASAPRPRGASAACPVKWSISAAVPLIVHHQI